MSDQRKIICGKCSQIWDLSGVSVASSARIRRSPCAGHGGAGGSGDTATRLLDVPAALLWEKVLLFSVEKKASWAPEPL